MTMLFATSLVHFDPAIFVETSTFAEADNNEAMRSALSVRSLLNSPTVSQVPDRDVFRVTSPGSYMSADSSIAHPIVLDRPTILAMVSSVIEFCTPTTTPSCAR